MQATSAKVAGEFSGAQVLSFGELGENDVAQVGGRAANLGGLTRPRAYILLDIRPGCLDQARQRLQGAPGVVSADKIHGPPDLIVITEAAVYGDLVRETIDAFMAVDRSCLASCG